MKGIELCKKYYETYGIPLIKKDFLQYEERIAVGIVGQGSECYGYDDDISKDHDFCAGFCIWLTEKDEEKFGFQLMRAYKKLPKEFLNIKIEDTSYLGDTKFGVFVIEEFYEKLIGKKPPLTRWEDWFYTPEYAMANAVNGKIFTDPIGIFTQYRKELEDNMPEDVRLKKIAARAALMAQSGQYNYMRCINHHELGAAQLAINEFVNNCIFLIFALNKKYTPFYKWRFRRLKELPILSNTVPDLEYLLMSDNNDPQSKFQIIEKISYLIIQEMKNQDITNNNSEYLESHAISVTNKIKNKEIKSLHLMECGE